MTRSIRETRSVRGTRRGATALLAGAAAATLLLSGCGAGQIAETAIKVPTVPGINVDGADDAIQLRSLLVPYNNPAGYPAGESAPISVAIFNTTRQPITVHVTSAPSADAAGQETVVAGRSVVIGAAASPETTASPDEAESTATPDPEATATEAPEQAERPAEITVPADGFVIFDERSAQPLRVTGLDGALTPGKAVSLIFRYEYNGKQQELRVNAPVTTPLSPAPRASSEQGFRGE